ATLNANAFDGGIGVKYYLSDEWAARGGLQFASANQNVPHPSPPGTDGSISAWSVGVSGSLEYHLTKTRVSPYLGGGVGFSLARTESKSIADPGADQTTTKNFFGGVTIGGQPYLSGTRLSVFGLAGVEYFFVKEVSLAAEYRLGFASTSRPDQEVIVGNTTTTTPIGSTTVLAIATGGVLTLAVYF
ncbi:MAG: outer membrane protein, partial [Bacteroidota bacterium]